MTVTDQTEAKTFTTTGSAEPNEGTEQVTTGTSAEETRSNLLRQAYGAATTRLREEYRKEFEAFYIEEAKNRGVDYTPKQTPEQKAEAEFQRLLEQYPDLAKKVQQQG